MPTMFGRRLHVDAFVIVHTDQMTDRMTDKHHRSHNIRLSGGKNYYTRSVAAGVRPTRYAPARL